MIRKQLCPKCRGDRYIKVVTPRGSTYQKCPECAGNGYRIEVVSSFK